MDPFLVGEDLKNALTILPPYNESIRSASKAERLLALNDIFDIYYPSMMAAEIYSKLYLAYVRAWQKKNTITAIQQGYENRKASKGQFYKGIIGGCDSFTIIGASGIGKSTAISRAISLISKSIPEEDNTQAIPFLAIQTPGDSSLKGLLMEILRTVDAMLNTKYYQDAIRSRATVDMLIGLVSQVSLNHLCVLIIDEAQNLVSAKNGQTLVNTLVQLMPSLSSEELIPYGRMKDIKVTKEMFPKPNNQRIKVQFDHKLYTYLISTLPQKQAKMLQQSYRNSPLWQLNLEKN